ncbi:MAG: anthranilate synthase component I family protein [Conexivisphaera sp.]
MRAVPASSLPPPLDLFLMIRESGSPAALLESVEGPQSRSRYSIVAWGARRRLTLRSGTREALRELRESVGRARRLDLPGRFRGGLIGYVSYEAASIFEGLDLPRDPEGWPLMDFFEPEDVAVYDSVEGVVRLTREPGGSVPGPGEAPRFRPLDERPSEGEFLRSVARVKGLIEEGRAFQVVLSRYRRYEASGDLAHLYVSLRSINPSPYMYYLHMGDSEIVGASPETLFRIEGRHVETFPIAGTRPRGRTPDEDLALEAEMVASRKERAEHLMLVDLARNDLGRVCAPGTVEVPELMYVEKYSHVQHMVSRVAGSLSAGADDVDVLEAVFPAGTVSGAPKPTAMRIIAEEEGVGRGPYAGAVGYLLPGSSQMSIAIRSAFYRGGILRLQAGAGIVSDSIPEMELEEVRHKMRALEAAMSGA